MEVATGWPTDDRRVWDGNYDDRREGGRLGVDCNRQTLEVSGCQANHYSRLWRLT